MPKKRKRKTHLLAKPDYIIAVITWIIGRVTGLQFHRIVKLSTTPPIPLPPGVVHQTIYNTGDIDALEREIESSLNKHSGKSIRKTIEHDGHLHFLSIDSQIVCQLNVLQGSIVVDSPSWLRISLAPKLRFISYLHTREKFRGRGFATTLVQAAAHNEHELQHCNFLAHIRSTNYTSMMAFRNASGRPCAWIISTRKGRYLGSIGCRRAGLKITPVTPDS